jgi:alanyl-tRNA synthetase
VFVGYDSTEADVQVRAIIVGDKVVDSLDSLPADTAAILVLDRTPFYGESGGQVGDYGQITSDSGQVQVVDTQKDGDLVLHQVAELVGRIAVGQKVTAQVDRARRDAIRRAHSATHILHYALQKNLGKHAQQQGSKVTDDWLRFDFTNLAPVSPEQLEQITIDVRERIVANESVGWKTVPLEEARAAGAMMLFGEKYPDPVRMVSMGQFSRELCGGTHLTATGDVEAFEVVSEEGVSAGTRRITALTGDKAREYQERTRTTLQKAATTLGVGESAVPGLARQLLQQVRDARKQLGGSGKAATPEAATSAGPTITDARQLLRETARLLNVSLFEVADRLVALKKEAEDLQRQLANREAHQGPTAEDLLAAAALVQNVRVVVAEVPGSNSNLLRQMIDQIRQTVSPCAIFLATAEGDDKVVLVAGVSRDLQGKLHAGNWVKEVAPVVGGGGGGKPDLAQAGGKDASKLPAALQHAKAVVEGWLRA